MLERSVHRVRARRLHQDQQGCCPGQPWQRSARASSSPESDHW